MPISLDLVEQKTARQVGLRRGTFVLPVFSLSGFTWNGYTELVRQYNYISTSPFVLTNPPARPASATYALCIRWRVGEVVTRFKVWDDDSQALGLVGAPVYNGQTIPANFVLEIFTILNITAPVNAAAITLNTTVRTVPTSYTDDSAFEVDDSPTLVTDYQVAMPARGTGHAALYESSSLTEGTPITWPDTSGNNLNLVFPTGTLLSLITTDGSVFKNNRYIRFDDGRLAITPATPFVPTISFTVFNIETFVDGARINTLNNSATLNMWDDGGVKKLRIGGEDINFTLQEDVNYLLYVRLSALAGDILIEAEIWGDTEGSVLATISTSVLANSTLQLGDIVVSGFKVRIAEAVIFTDVAITNAVKFAERDYLITKYIGWTTDLSWNDPNLVGVDNP